MHPQISDAQLFLFCMKFHALFVMILFLILFLTLGGQQLDSQSNIFMKKYYGKQRM